LSCSLTLAAAQNTDALDRARALAPQDDEISSALGDYKQASGPDERKEQADRIEGLVRRHEVLNRDIVKEDLSDTVRRIKSNPIYQDPAEGQQANWLQDSVERLGNAIRKRFNPDNERRPRDMAMPNIGGIGDVLRVLVWVLLGGAIAFFIYLVAKHVRWKQTLVRRSKAILEDDEPERSLDEWLALADEHEKAGRYREAVRCLYLACLLKFDESMIARFDRGDTNWEHLYRIEASPNLPSGLDFRSPTKHFDNVWYGHIVQGSSDVAEFRRVYVEVRDRTHRRAA